MRRFIFGVGAVLLVAGGLHAQSFATGPCNSGDEGTTNNGWFSSSRVKVCEMRRTTLPVNGEVNVSATNGSIEVIGEDRGDIALEAKVTAEDSSRDAAQSILREVEVKTNGTIEAKGPKFSGWSHADWSVSYKLRVPRRLAADVTSVNGEVQVIGVDGAIHAATVNGTVSLANLAGEVHAETVNGGVHIALGGHTWHGAGLWAKTVNGGVSVKAAGDYSAHLVADTLNGGISAGFPITVQGKIGHHVDGNLGSGGATLQFTTVNGGVSVERE